MLDVCRVACGVLISASLALVIGVSSFTGFFNTFQKKYAVCDRNELFFSQTKHSCIPAPRVPPLP